MSDYVRLVEQAREAARGWHNPHVKRLLADLADAVDELRVQRRDGFALAREHEAKRNHCPGCGQPHLHPEEYCHHCAPRTVGPGLEDPVMVFDSAGMVDVDVGDDEDMLDDE